MIQNLREQIAEYISCALNMPLVSGYRQLEAMVILHFGIPDIEAERVVWELLPKVLVKETLPELAKEAGYKSPEECKNCADGFISTCENDDLRAAWAKANGYVKLAKDQSLPYRMYTDGSPKAYKQSQQDMLKAGWRKVEEE